MRKSYLLYTSAVALVLLGAACAKKASVTTNTEEAANTSVEIENTNVTAGENINASTSVNTNTSGSTNTNTSKNTNSTTTSGSLTIDEPAANAEVESPVTVSGKSQVKTVYVRVIGNQNATLFTEPVTVRNGVYVIHLTLALTHSVNGRIEVYEKDTAGAEINTVGIPVNFQIAVSTTQTTNANSNENTNTSTNQNTNTYYPY